MASVASRNQIGRGSEVKSRSKFRNVPTAGYHSKREAKRAWELGVLANNQQIVDLQEQVVFILAEKNDADKRPLRYVADFVYKEWDSKQWVEIVEDCKGYRTEVYKVKKRWVWEKFGIRIRET